MLPALAIARKSTIDSPYCQCCELEKSHIQKEGRGRYLFKMWFKDTREAIPLVQQWERSAKYQDTFKSVFKAHNSVRVSHIKEKINYVSERMSKMALTVDKEL